MDCEQPVRRELRAATAEAHTRVDRAFSSFDLSHRDGYGRFLEAQARPLLSLEAALDEGIAGELGVDWSSRRRSKALAQDLAALGRPAHAGAKLPAIDVPERALGMIYVLEGSRLGGALLRRSVARGLPTAFLSPGRSNMWRDLLATLEFSLVSPAQRCEAIAGALFAFELFERSAAAKAAEMAL